LLTEKYVLLYILDRYDFFSQMLFAEMGRDLPEWFWQGPTQADTQVRTTYQHINAFPYLRIRKPLL
jgi:hypothetical protein